VVLPDGHALLIDMGGADTYNCHAGANASGLNGVSVCLDLGAGNDTYNRIDDPDNVDRTQNPSDDNTSQQGAGRMGIGMLVDFGGNDDYASVRLSQGSAVFGVGLLADLGGGDDYAMEAMGQGAAFGGVGLLLDQGGADHYDGWHKVQGFGGIMGIGILCDRGTGVDHYYAEPNLSAAKPEYSGWFGLDADSKNLSLAQGAGIGLSINLLTVGGTKIAGGGGFGLLFDHGGSDFYTGGAFAQAGSYYQSTGVLIDWDGDDDYAGYTFAQGAASNTGLACLFDLQGADSLSVETGAGLGTGNGAAIAWVIDRAGSDIYDAAGLGLGSGNNNGFGYFIDFFGDEQYGSHTSGFENTTLGKGNLGGGTAELPTFGIFVDDEGTDTYALGYSNMANASPDLPGNGNAWVRTVDGAYTNGRGSGIDVP
jgi:hypothetical protein